MSDPNPQQSEGQQSQSSPPMPSTPPIQAGPLARPALGYASGAPSTWPTVIGVIGIVFGAGAVLLTLGGFGFALLMRNAPGMPPNPQFEDRWLPWTLASMFVTCAVAILLLVAGVGITKRRAWAPRLAKVWAILKMVIVLGSMIIGFQTQQETMEALQQSAGPSPMPNLEGLVAFSMCGGVLWGWALPVFMLIWFSRSSVKEEISRWS